MLLVSIFDYVWFECSKSEQNWTSVFKYLDMVTVSDEKNEYERILDYLETSSEFGSGHPAVKNYKFFKRSSGNDAVDPGNPVCQAAVLPPGKSAVAYEL